jgi:two-component system chemotaxis response regulator CheY
MEKTMKACIIDDSTATRFMIAKIMKELGFVTFEAQDGEEALKKLALNQDTSLVLVDWNMPVMNGLDFVSHARHDARFKGMKLMMVTTEAELTSVMKALEAGADEYVMKPFTKEMIAEKIRLLGITLTQAS